MLMCVWKRDREIEREGIERGIGRQTEKEEQREGEREKGEIECVREL